MTPSVLTVRPASPADLGEVDRLLSLSFPALLKRDYAPSVMVTAVPVLARARPALLACGTYFVAQAEDGRIVGAGGWTSQRRDPSLADIRHLVTDHRHTRQGIGRALLGHALAAGAAAGIVRFDCLSTLTAVPFYRALGFADLGPITMSLGPGIAFPVVQMTRPA